MLRPVAELRLVGNYITEYGEVLSLHYTDKGWVDHQGSMWSEGASRYCPQVEGEPIQGCVLYDINGSYSYILLSWLKRLEATGVGSMPLLRKALEGIQDKPIKHVPLSDNVIKARGIKDPKVPIGGSFSYSRFPRTCTTGIIYNLPGAHGFRLKENTKAEWQKHMSRVVGSSCKPLIIVSVTVEQEEMLIQDKSQAQLLKEFGFKRGLTHSRGAFWLLGGIKEK